MMKELPKTFQLRFDPIYKQDQSSDDLPLTYPWKRFKKAIEIRLNYFGSHTHKSQQLSNPFLRTD